MTILAAPAPTLNIGPIVLDVPVVLAPMAGITNTAFRRLCREYGAGLYVSEMITSRALVERTPESMRLIRHHESETPRSIQLYGVDPKTVAEAVTMLVAEDRAALDAVVPEDFWRELRKEGLVHPSAPLPANRSTICNPSILKNLQGRLWASTTDCWPTYLPALLRNRDSLWKIQSTTTAVTEAIAPKAMLPTPHARPAAPAIHMPAPVVRPLTLPPDVMIDPAARNAGRPNRQGQ